MSEPVVSTPPSDDELIFGLALANADGVGIRGYHDRRTQFGGSEMAFRHAVEGARQRQLLAEATNLMAAARERGVAIVAAHDPRYPAALLTLRDAPPHLFALGALHLLERPAVAIVGTRRATPYGLRATRVLAAELARAGCVIISGLARGIDTAAHEAALDAGGATVAVLGTGVDVPYPRLNRALHARIARDGLLVSELPCGTQAFPGSFPRRNRLIAGLARAVIVSEAPARSGALITAAIAADIGRDVGCLPGNIDSPASAGSNRLLRDGATPILEVGDAFSLCGLERAPDPAQRSPDALSDDAQLLWRALTASGPLSADALTRASGIDARRAAPALAALELAGWVEIDHAGVIFAR